jgi:glycosyltransferase involved in cell wall biosynthesis
MPTDGPRHGGSPARADEVLDAARRRFAAEYEPPSRRPGVVVVIAALNEAPTVASVIAAAPAEVGGLGVETILVDDGSTDDTADRAEAAGALVCRLESNMGQGSALRLGYQLAIERGAMIIATADADGQLDLGELPRLVAPILEGRADFVNGSRRLGSAEHANALRRAGVVVFGLLVTVLTGTRITDPANGLRAFRVEVATSVPLRQPQYQTSELLIGALTRGFRVVEEPVAVHARGAGSSKKGTNLSYAWGFTRAVLAAWWSGRSARPGVNTNSSKQMNLAKKNTADTAR